MWMRVSSLQSFCLLIIQNSTMQLACVVYDFVTKRPTLIRNSLPKIILCSQPCNKILVTPDLKMIAMCERLLHGG